VVAGGDGVGVLVQDHGPGSGDAGVRGAGCGGVGYYVVAALRGYEGSTAYIVFWLVAALVFGAVGGYTAGLMREREPAKRLAGLAVPAAVLIGEGACIATGTGNPELMPYGIGSAMAGVILGAVGVARMARTTRQCALAPLGILVLSAIVFGGIEAAGIVMA
jgi:hypothetical protein